jgi:uncharacterized protein YunC (DUF1805 family)
MLVAEIERIAGVPIMLMDSIAAVLPEHRGAIVVCGSHGGHSAGEYALKVKLRAVFFNDAGIGKDQAGVVALAMLQAVAVPSCAIAHDSGRIGDARDMWQNGMLSRVNPAAQALGLRSGMAVREAVAQLAAGRGAPSEGS